MKLMTHEDYQDLLAMHALSALEPAEMRLLEEHLQECASCLAELDEWRTSAAALALTANPAEPSPGIRNRILEQVHSEKSSSTTESQAHSKILPFRPSWTSHSASPGLLTAIAAAIAILTLVVSLLVLWRENRSAREELARLSAEVQRNQEQLSRQRQALELLNSPGARLAELKGTSVAPGAHATLAYDRDGHAILLAKGLPPAPSGKAYQLWFIVGNQPLPGKVFTTDTAGNGSLNDEVPATALASAVFAITLEPATGMKAPTGAIYLASGS
jgi:anti-sigma-K factor RskA